MAPLPGLPFGCAVTELDLADGSLSDAQFAVLAEAFHTYGVCVLRGQDRLHPRQEVELARRLEALWCDTPAAIAERDPSASNLRGCNPPGFPEVAVLGNGVVHDHFGLSGRKHTPRNPSAQAGLRASERWTPLRDCLRLQRSRSLGH